MLRDAGHDVAISALWGLDGKALEWNGLQVYPADGAWGNKWLPAIVAHHAGIGNDPRDALLLTLIDVWPLTSSLFSQLRVASWTPVDHDPAPPRVVEFFTRTGARPIAMSRFGESRLQQAGLDPLYVPHGVDTELLQPRDQAEAKQMLGLPKDAFVVGMVAANKSNMPCRKAFPQVFQAFARFHETHPDAILYLHTAKDGGDHGINLIALADQCGLPLEAVRWTSEFDLAMGLINYEFMAIFYSAMDVLANPSYGEGFGIPIVEAQACGVPVIVTDYTAMPELCGAGWLVEGDPWYDTTQGAWFKHPSVDSIIDALEHAYQDAAGLRGRAREFALGYDVRRVMADHWTPTLEALDRPREVPPLSLNGRGPNREVRRRMAKAKTR